MPAPLKNFLSFPPYQTTHKPIFSSSSSLFFFFFFENEPGNTIKLKLAYNREQRKGKNMLSITGLTFSPIYQQNLL